MDTYTLYSTRSCGSEWQSVAIKREIQISFEMAGDRFDDCASLTPNTSNPEIFLSKQKPKASNSENLRAPGSSPEVLHSSFQASKATTSDSELG